ncbi:MAG: transposase family protein, partial [Deltaproteobacteria bacterium]|nr:transposase family protein [Deltaproteobacteria bacterium]
NIIAYFKTIPDVRVKGRSTYKLYQILTILLIATTAGCKGLPRICQKGGQNLNLWHNNTRKMEFLQKK